MQNYMKKMMIKNTIRNSIYIIKNRENLLIKDYQYQNKDKHFYKGSMSIVGVENFKSFLPQLF